MSIVWGPADQEHDERPRCITCGSPQTRIVGQSGRPPVVHYRCEACGEVFSLPLLDSK